MSTEGIEAVFVETHNWGKTAKFFQGLGFRLEFETDHHSGQLRNGDGPYVFVAEIPPDRDASVQLVLKVGGRSRSFRTDTRYRGGLDLGRYALRHPAR